MCLCIITAQGCFVCEFPGSSDQFFFWGVSSTLLVIDGGVSCRDVRVQILYFYSQKPFLLLMGVTQLLQGCESSDFTFNLISDFFAFHKTPFSDFWKALLFRHFRLRQIFQTFSQTQPCSYWQGRGVGLLVIGGGGVSSCYWEGVCVFSLVMEECVPCYLGGILLWRDGEGDLIFQFWLFVHHATLHIRAIKTVLTLS